jgi:hypothetical protein
MSERGFNRKVLVGTFNAGYLKKKLFSSFIFLYLNGIVQRGLKEAKVVSIDRY